MDVNERNQSLRPTEINLEREKMKIVNRMDCMNVIFVVLLILGATIAAIVTATVGPLDENDDVSTISTSTSVLKSSTSRKSTLLPSNTPVPASRTTVPPKMSSTLTLPSSKPAATTAKPAVPTSSPVLESSTNRHSTHLSSKIPVHASTTTVPPKMSSTLTLPSSKPPMTTVKPGNISEESYAY
ncbi:hypothetical protein OESDEN_20558 [Oesophagostomum dentatum]|uniref:Uncharacterized protein n=1 Tax=Oesophagostomum dentatum TaxID=61180 RepID=A0A0B1S992_OESDE|nr:hypothetical protein OESDEN_20558 [Oesophagostomum dentatum]